MKTILETKPQSSENSEKISDKRLLNLKPPYKKGESGNLDGRPLGQKNYATLYKEALIKLAKLNNKEPAELELELISKGIMSARGGDYRFYKDILDRLLGQATQSTQTLNLNANVNIGNIEELKKIAGMIGNNIEDGFKKSH